MYVYISVLEPSTLLETNVIRAKIKKKAVLVYFHFEGFREFWYNFGVHVGASECHGCELI